jgi:outer membrane biosynthesis protein TonB
LLWLWSWLWRLLAWVMLLFSTEAQRAEMQPPPQPMPMLGIKTSAPVSQRTSEMMAGATASRETTFEVTYLSRQELLHQQTVLPKEPTPKPKPEQKAELKAQQKVEPKPETHAPAKAKQVALLQVEETKSMSHAGSARALDHSAQTVQATLSPNLPDLQKLEQKEKLSLTPRLSGQGVRAPQGGGQGQKSNVATLGQGDSLTEVVRQRILVVAQLIGPASVNTLGKGDAASALVRFETDPEGYVEHFWIVESTGIPKLDEQLFPILHLGEPYPPQSNYSVRIPFFRWANAYVRADGIPTVIVTVPGVPRP